MLNIQKVRVLCFDVDGTLSDTDDYYADKFSARFQRLPRFMVRDPERAARRLVMWSESPGNALLGLSDTIGLDRPIITLIDFIYRHRKKKWRQFLVVPGVQEMLARLKGRYPMVIVSARDEDSTMTFLQEFDLVKYFDVVVSVLSARHTKPYPDPILLAAHKNGSRAGGVFDDRRYDRRCACRQSRRFTDRQCVVRLRRGRRVTPQKSGSDSAKHCRFSRHAARKIKNMMPLRGGCTSRRSNPYCQ